jgi:predicted transcriptional regulator
MIVENQQRLTSQIVAAYVRKNLISTDQIAALINSVHSTLSGLGNEVVEEPPRIPAVSVRRSVHPDYIVCIECGYKAKMLKRHLLSRHGVSVTEYRTRWNLSSDYPLTSPNYSERRSQFAKSIGLGRGRSQPAAISAAAPEPAPETTPEKPARRRSASKSSKTKAKKASSRISAKKAGDRSRSRKPATTTKKARSSPEGATA